MRRHIRSKVNPDKLLKGIALLAVALYPFWFITFFGMNLGLPDLLMLVIFSILVIRNKRFFFGPKLIVYPSILFLTFLSLSAIINYESTSYTAYIQYFWIFLVVIPVVAYYSTNNEWRHHAILTLSVVTGAITIHTLYIGLFTPAEWDAGGGTYRWRFSIYNQLYWIIATSALLNLGVAFDKGLRLIVRIFGSVSFISGFIIIINSQTQSAILMLLIGVSVICLSFLKYMGKDRSVKTFASAAIISYLVGIMYTLSNWSHIYDIGNLDSRFEQYERAIIGGATEQPFGAGLRSASNLIGGSVHNFAFSYWYEIGIFALVSYCIFLIIIVRYSYFGILNSSEFRPIELSIFGIFFATLSLLFFQPELVRRFWYIIYAIIIGTVGKVSNKA